MSDDIGAAILESLEMTVIFGIIGSLGISRRGFRGENLLEAVEICRLV